LYGKLFESTFGGSMYGKGAVIFSVWCYAIAHTRPDSMVELNPDLVANAIGCKPKDVFDAIAFLCRPDRKSSTKEEGGKRLVREGEYLYRTVNYKKYNTMRNEPERREYNKIKQRESRARKRQAVSSDGVKQCQDGQPMYAVPVPVPVASDSDNPTAAAHPEYPPEFRELQTLYPKRGGGNPWPRALRACKARIAEGHTWEEITSGVCRYSEFVRATGKTGTEFVLQAATFFGPDKRFLESWELPATKAEVRQEQQADAARDWLALKGEYAGH
jgi:hypothetical protein